MSEQAQAPAPQVGQPEVGNPQAPQQGQQPAGAPAAQTPQAPAQPDNTAAAELAALKAELENTRNSARHFQSLADKSQQQLRGLVGAEQPQDPLDPFVKRLTAKGYSPEDARTFVELTNEMVTPLRQQLQSANAAVQATAQVDGTMQQAYTADPQLFADPDVATYVRNELQAAALSGNASYVNPAYAKACAAQAWAEKHQPWRTQGAPPVQMPGPTAPQRFMGAPGGFTPAAPTGPVKSPGSERVDAEIANYLKQ